jgi:hypothetical protein
VPLLVTWTARSFHRRHAVRRAHEFTRAAHGSRARALPHTPFVPRSVPPRSPLT